MASGNMAVSGSKERRARPVYRSMVVHGFILAILVIYAAPIVGVVLTSLQSNAEIAARGVWHIPEAASFENFVDVWTTTATPRYLLNSFLVTIPATALSILGGLLLGYVFTTLKFPAAELLFLLVIAGMFFPPQAMLIPLFRLFNSPIEIAGFQVLPALYDTVYPMIIIHMSLGLAITTLLLRNFMNALPSGLREAAIVDGAGEWSVLFKVIVPLTLPALAVLATLQFTWIWNDFLWPLVLTRSEEAKTIMAGINALKGQYNVAWANQAAMAVIASVPTIVIFIAFQRYFISGLTMGSMKE
ncbi:MAG: carbohydrate ABC transporter permease [Chloroflexota bacterium]|nr:carbohydrate ABC transporter permease [Chloroflexota bacterium]